MKNNENQWKSMKINENQWKSMKTNENPEISKLKISLAALCDRQGVPRIIIKCHKYIVFTMIFKKICNLRFFRIFKYFVDFLRHFSDQNPSNIDRIHWFSLIFHEKSLHADGPISETTWSWKTNPICAHSFVPRWFHFL